MARALADRVACISTAGLCGLLREGLLTEFEQENAWLERCRPDASLGASVFRVNRTVSTRCTSLSHRD